MKAPLSGTSPVHLTTRRYRLGHFLVRRKKPVQRRRFVSEPQHPQRTQDPRHPEVIMAEPRDPVSRVDPEIRSANDDFLPGSAAELQAVETQHPLQRAAETGSQLGLGQEGAADFGRDDRREAEHALFGEWEDGLDVVVRALEPRVWP